MPLDPEVMEAAHKAELKLTEILKNVKLNPDGTLSKEVVEKVNKALTDITNERATPPIALREVPGDVKSQFYKTAADFYHEKEKTEPSHKSDYLRYKMAYEISKKNKI
jgi:hypothetical protein